MDLKHNVYLFFIPWMLQGLFTRVAQIRVSLHQMYDEVLSWEYSK